MQQAGLSLPDCIIKSAGIDWLTLTTVSDHTKKSMLRCFSRLVAADLKAGYKVVNGGAYGFFGKRTRHALLAEKDDRMMLQLSSDDAKQAIQLIYPDDNATRIDVQMTVFIGEEKIHDYLVFQESNARSKRAIRGKHAVVDHYASNGQYQTVYIGKRSSDVYVRLYDKFAKEQEECYRGCVRLEAEIKGKKAKALWAYLEKEVQAGLRVLQFLLSLLEDRGLDVSGIDLDRANIVLPKPEPFKETVSLAWLASQVAPTVARLSASHGWLHVFSVLFSGAVEDIDRRAILRALAMQWGN